MNIGSLVIDLKGIELDDIAAAQLQHPLIGGVILFARNYQNKTQLRQLCKEIRAVRKKPLLIMADQEGGRVQRFKDGFFHLPPMAQFGSLYHCDPKKALSLTRDAGFLLAVELLACDIDLSLGPVLDLNQGVSHVIGDRAFDADPEVVTELAKEFIHGMQHAGMAPVIKHFPGHGSIEADSHLMVAVDQRPYELIEKTDLIPFARLVCTQVPAIMAAHVTYPGVDEQPVGYSKRWLKDILRQRLGFKGAIFSDDLSMEAANISGYYPDRALAARRAGCDFLLLCNQPQAIQDCLDQLNPLDFQVSEALWQPLMQHKAVSNEQGISETLQLIGKRINNELTKCEK